MRVAIDARKLHDYGIGTYVRAAAETDAEGLPLVSPEVVVVANIPKKTLLRKLQKYGINARDYN